MQLRLSIPPLVQRGHDFTEGDLTQVRVALSIPSRGQQGLQLMLPIARILQHMRFNSTPCQRGLRLRLPGRTRVLDYVSILPRA